MLQAIWYLIIISMGGSITLLVLLNIRYLILDRRKKRNKIHVDQLELTEFLYECIEEFGEDKPAWTNRYTRNMQD